MALTEEQSDDVDLAHQLYAEWDEGRGTSKSEIERREWKDGGAHGRRFDRFIFQHLGIKTSKKSKQTDRIAELQRQVRSLGMHPCDTTPTLVDQQLQHARSACLQALKIWNDPDSMFRTAGFSLSFVTAWNSLALAVLQRDGVEWRLLKAGEPFLRAGVEQSQDTIELVKLAFAGDNSAGLRGNLQFWIDLRNAVAHRCLPALDHSVIPHAQAGLLNFERIVVDEFGDEYQLAERLSVPLQLSGFRDPDVLASRKQALASLPLDVQALLSRAEKTTPELLVDETFMMRVAFVPFVPASGRNPDAVAYFVRPGEVPQDLAESIDRYVVLPKPARGPRPSLRATEVAEQVRKKIPFRFTTTDHLAVARYLKVRPAKGQSEESLNEIYCEYISALKRHLYNKAWVDRIVEQISTEKGYREAVGREPVLVDSESPG